MRFKIKKGSDKPKHSEIVSCLGWSSNELFSIGDDNAIWKWDIYGEPVSHSLFYKLQFQLRFSF